MKETSNPSIILQGEFGRLTLNLTARSVVEHAHAAYQFIFKAGGGDTGFKVNGSRLELTDTKAILVNPWEPHSKLDSQGKATLALTVQVEPAWLSATLGRDAPLRSRLFPKPCVALDDTVRDHVLRMGISLSAGMDATDADREALLRDLVRSIVTAYATGEFSRQSVLPERPVDARIMRAVRLLHELSADNPHLDDIAARVGLSRSRFFEQFKSCIGVSPQQYLDWERMTIATRKLANPGSSIAQVSDDLGFSAPSHFTRFFSQHIGLPPSDFKRGMLTPAPDA
ncbi:MAG: helix-turn-helix domain-containing protein [Pseudomonadota bacterium]